MTEAEMRELDIKFSDEIDRRYPAIPVWIAQKVKQHGGFVVGARIVGERVWAKIKDNDDYFSIPDDDLRDLVRPLIEASTPSHMSLICDDAPVGTGHLVLAPMH